MSSVTAAEERRNKDADNETRSRDSTTLLVAAEHYDSSEYISGPTRVKDGTVPIDILEFQYYNLCVADPNTVIFASGNLIHFLDTTKQAGDDAGLSFRPSSTGRGIGHITKNPSVNHIAVGENGMEPPIIIYEWPGMEIVTVLHRGTIRSYTHLAYSPDGQLLVSQGGEPDYTITVWNWKESRILLRCKSHGQDVYNAAFAPSSVSTAGLLTTSGAGHVKFWKMSRTFTGLKLRGQLGRFGKTESSDIIGVYSMPADTSKLVSGCEWGNILLWDQDSIELQICRKNRKTCHGGKLITQFELTNAGELMSVGMDGWIRIWSCETILQADPPDEDDRFLEIEPIYEFQIGETDSKDWQENSMLMCIQKQDPRRDLETRWYAQDGNGGLWLIDLGTFDSKSLKLVTCHAGPITSMDRCTWSTFVATCGKDGHVHIYNYSTRRLVLVHKFRDKATRVVWFPCSVESTGSTLACAFESGIVRVITVAVLAADKSADKDLDASGDYVRLIQVSKPHTSAITAMSLNPSNSVLVTGSEDSTLFIFGIERRNAELPSLVPIGYIRLFSPVSCTTWRPGHRNTILVGCTRGDCAEIQVPEEQQEYTTISYELVNTRPRFFKFQSVKSKIRRESARIENDKRKEAERESRRRKIEKLRSDVPGIEIDQESFLMADDMADMPLPDIYIPQVPNAVLMANYTAGGTIWLSMGGYDAGYVYEYPLPADADADEENYIPKEPIRSSVVFEADDVEIRSCLFYKNKYVILGMERGEIRVCRVNPNDAADFRDYWILPMHDNRNGCIPVILMSYDQRMLLSCGHDGNLFSYVINDDDDSSDTTVATEKARILHELPTTSVEDIEVADNHPSLNEIIVKLEKDRIMAAAKRKKDTTLRLLRNLSEEYSKLMERNRALAKSQQISQQELELDPRITADLNARLNAEMDLVHEKMAYKVARSRLGLRKLECHSIEPITCLPFGVSRILNPDTVVHSLREGKLGDEFFARYAHVVGRFEEKERAAASSRDSTLCEMANGDECLTGDDDDEIHPSSTTGAEYLEINPMLRKYRARKERMDQRAKEWKTINAAKPDPNLPHPDDTAAIRQAENTIGNYKLRIFDDDQRHQGERETTRTKYKQLLDCRKKNHHLREDFNARLRTVRDKKLALQNEVLELIDKLRRIHAEIPEKKIRALPAVPPVDYNVEYPEKNLALAKYTSMAERVKETKRRKMSITEETIINPMDEEYEVLLLDEILVKSELEAAVESLDPTRVRKVVDISEQQRFVEAGDPRETETACEREMKRSRATRKMYEQDYIMSRISDSYAELDRQLNELERERLDATADSVYSDLFFLTLHQELMILKDFEAMETALMDRVKEKLDESVIAGKKIRAIALRIDQKNFEIAKMRNKMTHLLVEFTNAVGNDNKYSDFLQKIYRKKFKLRRMPQDANNISDVDYSSASDSTSSTADSSSDDEDGAASLVSDDKLGQIPMDENICPIGCDKELYDLAFNMREQRYESENRIKEEEKSINLLRKELEADTRKLQLTENELAIHQRDLQDFMREKQKKLNDVDMTVILEFHQLRHFLDDDDDDDERRSVAKIRDCVVFDQTTLTRLYTRVGELQRETLEQMDQHKKNRTHLHRMKVDCKHMAAEMKRLNDEITREMMEKFGRLVSLDALSEAVLRKYLYTSDKAHFHETIDSFDEQIIRVKSSYRDQTDILENLIQDNTEKQSFLTVLEGERAKLSKILRLVPESEENIVKIEREYRDDLARLQNILTSQRHQKQLFRNDIGSLRRKSTATTQKPLQPGIAKKSEEDIVVVDPTSMERLASSSSLEDEAGRRRAIEIAMEYEAKDARSIGQYGNRA